MKKNHIIWFVSSWSSFTGFSTFRAGILSLKKNGLLSVEYSIKMARFFDSTMVMKWISKSWICQKPRKSSGRLVSMVKIKLSIS